MLCPTNGALFRKLAIAALMFMPLLAFAEVSDKAPALANIWSVGVVGGLICLVSGLYRQWLVPLLGLLPALWFVSLLIELHSADVGPFLYEEQGQVYYLQAYAALTIFLFACCIGWAVGARRKKAASS